MSHKSRKQNINTKARNKGKRGRERAIEHFSVKAGGRETEKVYKKAVGKE